MALEPIIRLGDKTTHGGTVLEGFANYSIYDIPASGLGHKVSCPLCKGVFPIVECIPSHTIDGIGVSVQGMKTGCGATLIASQGTALLEFTSGGSGGGQSSGASSPRSSAEAAASNASDSDAAYDLFFHVKDATTGESLPNTSYKITLEDGREFEGVTDENGHTEKVSADSALNATIEVPYHGNDDSSTYPNCQSDTCGC